MSPERPSSKTTPHSPDELNEIKLRETVEAPIEDFLSYIKIKMGQQAGSSPGTSFKEKLAFLEGLTPKEFEGRLFREAAEGEDTLLVSFFTLAVLNSRIQLHEKQERLRQEKENFGTILPQDTEMIQIFEDMHEQRIELFNWLLRHSQNFKEHYGPDDLRKLIEETESLYREYKSAGRPLNETEMEEYRMLDRVLAGNYQKPDRKILERIIDRSLDEELVSHEGTFINTLRSNSRNYALLMQQTKKLIRLYRLKDFISEVIPQKEQ